MLTPEVFETQVINLSPEAGSILYGKAWGAGNMDPVEAVWKPGEGSLWISADWGWNDDTSIGFWQFRDGLLYRFDELSGNQQDEKHWIRLALRRVTELEGYDGPPWDELVEAWDEDRWPDFGDVWPMAVVDPTAGHMRREWIKHGVTVADAADVKHDVVEGQDVLRAAMRTGGYLDDDGRAVLDEDDPIVRRLFVNPKTCPTYIAAVDSYAALELPDGSYSEKADPKPSNHRWSHPLDESRYLVWYLRDEIGVGEQWFVA